LLHMHIYISLILALWGSIGAPLSTVDIRGRRDDSSGLRIEWWSRDPQAFHLRRRHVSLMETVA